MLLYINTLLSVGLFSLTFVFCRDGFIKDQNEDLVDFPPSSYYSYDENIPVGHLRPLGWQRFPNGVVAEEKKLLSPLEFFTKYVSRKRVVVFRNVMVDVPALTLWNKTEYLQKRYGEIEVDVVVKKEFLRKGSKRIKFKKFLKDYLYDDLYLSNYIPLEMMHELILPECLNCGFNKWLMESELWMSSGGTSSLLHSHADHDLHCLLAGRKDFIFIDAKYRDIFAFHNEGPFDGAGHSKIDMDMINMFQLKDLADVPWTYAILRKGDCIYVPAGLLHQVRSYGKSISSTNHFAPSPELELSSCEGVETTPTPLDQAEFLWTYKSGKLMLSANRLDSDSMLRCLLKVMRSQELLTKEIFTHFYEEVMKEATGEYPPASEAWVYLSGSDQVESLPRVGVKSLPVDRLDKVARIFNIPNIQMDAKKKEEL